jgi:hypothetical protein
VITQIMAGSCNRICMMAGDHAKHIRKFSGGSKQLLLRLGAMIVVKRDARNSCSEMLAKEPSIDMLERLAAPGYRIATILWLACPTTEADLLPVVEVQSAQ